MPLKLMILAASMALLGYPILGLAATFNPANILSDEELFDHSSMGISEISYFLRAKNSGLGQLILPDYRGQTKSAAVIIYQAALEHKINPQFLLTVLQKEQSLVETPNPTDSQLNWAAGFGVCDNCTHSSANQDYRGFGKQVDYLASVQIKYMVENDQYRCRPYEPCLIDGIIITPENQATANLYNYTPHLDGNYAFWLLWKKYWSRHYPDGSLLQAHDSDDVWYIQDGRKRKIASRSILLSRFNPKKIIMVEATALDNYPVGTPVAFANYSLVRNEQGRIYLLVDDILRHIASPEVFKKIGFNWDEVQNVKDEDLSEYPEGEKITVATIAPVGTLVREAESGGIYWVADGVKRAIYSPEILRSRFAYWPIGQKIRKELEKLSTGKPVTFAEGELVKSDTEPTVYVISQGQRRPIASAEAFVRFGYSWDNIIVTKTPALEVHPLGEIIE